MVIQGQRFDAFPGSTANTNRTDIVLCQFCLGMFASASVNTKDMIVLAILFLGSPCQVGNAAIGFDTVQVPTLHPFRAWAVESFEDKSMETERLQFSVNGRCQIESRVSSCSKRRFHFSPRTAESTVGTGAPFSPNRPVIANAITRIALDFSILNDRIVGSHDARSSKTCVVVRACGCFSIRRLGYYTECIPDGAIAIAVAGA